MSPNVETRYAHERRALHHLGLQSAGELPAYGTMPVASSEGQQFEYHKYDRLFRHVESIVLYEAFYMEGVGLVWTYLTTNSIQTRLFQ